MVIRWILITLIYCAALKSWCLPCGDRKTNLNGNRTLRSANLIFANLPPTKQVATGFNVLAETPIKYLLLDFCSNEPEHLQRCGIAICSSVAHVQQTFNAARIICITCRMRCRWTFGCLWRHSDKNGHWPPAVEWGRAFLVEFIFLVASAARSPIARRAEIAKAPTIRNGGEF